ncbi:MAG: hypothetical protein IT203_00645 [Fimbriimonadaceae bacterium]|nr:hypothetical protein [Fimbriimonadaceae bacterium]
MKIHTRFLYLLFAIVGCLAACCGPMPQFVSRPAPAGSPIAGQSATYLVTMDDVVGSNTNVSITGSPSSAFSSIPSQVTVPAGYSTVSFNVTVASGYEGTIQVSASAGGATAWSSAEWVSPASSR